MVLCREIRPAVYRPIRDGSHKRYGVVFTYQFFPLLGSLIILRYTIQGAGYTKLAMFSGVSEMVARIMVSLVVVPLFGYLGVCYGDPTAWLFANLFLTPAFIYVYRRLKQIARPEAA